MAKKMSPMLSALGDIREELKLLREETRANRDGLTELGGGFAELRAAFGDMVRYQKEMEIRLATELVAVIGAVREVRDAILSQQGIGARVDDHERRLLALEQKTG